MPFPLCEVAAKTKIARLLPTEPGRQVMPLTALGVGQALVAAARDKNVRRQRIVSPPHFPDGRIHFAHDVAACRYSEYSTSPESFNSLQPKVTPRPL